MDRACRQFICRKIERFHGSSLPTSEHEFNDCENKHQHLRDGICLPPSKSKIVSMGTWRTPNRCAMRARDCQLRGMRIGFVHLRLRREGWPTVSITVHHQAVDSSKAYTLHAWSGGEHWDVVGSAVGGEGGGTDFDLPDVGDPAAIAVQIFCDGWDGGGDVGSRTILCWRIWQAAPAELWTFDITARVLHSEPLPAGVVFQGGDVVTLNVVTQSRFVNGRIYAWDPFNAAGPSAYFFSDWAGGGGVDVCGDARGVDGEGVSLEAGGCGEWV